MNSASRMTLGDKLAEYKARRLHVTDIKEPLVKALFWNQREREQMELARDLSKYPSEFGDLMDDVEMEAAYARTRRAFILSNEWETRKLR